MMVQFHPGLQFSKNITTETDGEKIMIVYKVVRKNRTSAIVWRLKDYSIKYPVGEIVSGKKGTLGIFCFKTFNHAFSFHNNNDKCMILKVRPIGKK